MGLIAELRHRSASAQLGGQCWEADVLRDSAGVWRGRIIARVILAAAEPTDFEVHVCTQRRLRHGAFIVSRVDQTTWLLAPAVALDDRGQLLARVSSFHTSLPIGSIALTFAPPDVADELSRLEE